MSVSIKEQADLDKKNLLDATQSYLKKAPSKTCKEIQETASAYRDNAENFLKDGNFSEAIANLEKLREAKTGIGIREIAGKPPIIIRDARNAADPKVRSTEAFEMQYLNSIRAAMDVTEIASKPELKKELQRKAENFMESFAINNEKTSQDQLSIKLRKEINGVAQLLEQNGIEGAYQKLNIAKDFQNFNDKHANIVTISTIKDNNNNRHTVIEAEVGFRQLTKEQKQEYQNVQNKFLNPKPKWFLALPNWESKLVEKYIPQITDGQHTISTQLRQIIGMKNSFEKVTAIFDDKTQELEVINSSKHSGTLASFARDEASRQALTNQNAQQAQEWIGKDNKLHTNTLNSGFAGISLPFHIDMQIVKSTNIAMEKIGGTNSNTAFNKFRLLGGFNNLQGAKNYLNEVSKNLVDPENPATMLQISNHLKPRGMFSRLLGLNKPKGNFDELIQGLEPKLVKALIEARDLRQDIEKADVPFRLFLDKENISLDISRKLNYATQKISEIAGKTPLKNMPKYEVLTMCASGKDRTGLAEFDQTSQAVAHRLNMNIQDIDKQFANTGHTSQQAGGAYAGGATIGCNGTLKVTEEGFPETRAESLSGVIEKSGATNKIIEYKEPNKSKEINIKPKQISSENNQIPPPDPTPPIQKSNSQEHTR